MDKYCIVFSCDVKATMLEGNFKVQTFNKGIKTFNWGIHVHEKGLRHKDHRVSCVDFIFFFLQVMIVNISKMRQSNEIKTLQVK